MVIQGGKRWDPIHLNPRSMDWSFASNVTGAERIRMRRNPVGDAGDAAYSSAMKIPARPFYGETLSHYAGKNATMSRRRARENGLPIAPRTAILN